MSIRQMWKRRMKRRRAKVFLEVEKLSWRITYFRTRKKKNKQQKTRRQLGIQALEGYQYIEIY